MILQFAAGAFLVFCLLLLKRSNRPKQLLPPGPKRLPLLGNILDVPTEKVALHWAKHEALYGPISSVSVLDQTIVIINDKEVAFELLDKRSSGYSSRPRFVFAGEMCGFGNVVTLLPYGDHLREARKRMYPVFGTKESVKKFQDLQEFEARRFLARLTGNQEDLIANIRATVGAIILKVAYGYSVTPEGLDPLVHLADVITDNFSEAVLPGKWKVDAFPFLQWLPEWVPGMGFKKTAERWHALTTEFVEKPYAFVKQQMAAGDAPYSLASALISDGTDEEDFKKGLLGGVYGGGSETTVASLTTFFLAMACYPEVFKRAQAEIDSVIGTDRLPAQEDRALCPYIEAIVMETVRWNTAAPMGMVHTTTEEDVYRGYSIPKGSLVLANIWKFTHDPAVYHDPMEFKPERFLGEKAEPDPRQIVFGFGRRVCPGQSLAESTLFIIVAMCIAGLDISKMRDEEGRELHLPAEFTHGFISHPKPFKCSILPRSAQVMSLIAAANDDHPLNSSDVEKLETVKW